MDQITLSGLASWDDRGNGTPLQRNRMSGGTFAMSYDRLLSGTTLGAKFSFSPNAFQQTFTTVSSNRQTETLTSTQFINTAATRLVAEVGRVLPRGYMTARYGLTRTGADFTERRATSSVRQVLEDDSDAVSVHAGWSVTNSVSFGMGVRREWRAAPREGDERDSATVGNVTGSWRLSPHVAIRGAASSSHRWPTLNEMVRNFQVGAILTRANAGLLPERAVSAEGALAYLGRQLARVRRRILDGRRGRHRERHHSVHADHHSRTPQRRRGARQGPRARLRHPSHLDADASRLRARRRFAVPRIARARARGQMAAAGSRSIPSR